MIRLSNSAVDKYLTCPKMYKYHYVDRIRSNRKSSPLLFGIAIDEALNDLVVNKDLNKARNIYEDLMLEWKYDYDVDFLRKDYDDQVIPDDILGTLENEHEICWHSLWYKGLEFLGAYFEQIIPRLGDVKDVQRAINLKNEDGDSIIGYQDVFAELDGELTIIDNKTSSSSYSKRKIEESQQLHLYSYAEKVESIAYVVMRKDYSAKGEMRPIQVLKYQANPEVINTVLNRFDEVLSKIKNKEFPKTENKFTCRNHFGKPCIYLDVCQNGKKANEISHLEDLGKRKEIK